MVEGQPVSPYCDCDPPCKPFGVRPLLHPGVVWADVVREIEEFAAENPKEES